MERMLVCEFTFLGLMIPVCKTFDFAIIIIIDVSKSLKIYIKIFCYKIQIALSYFSVFSWCRFFDVLLKFSPKLLIKPLLNLWFIEFLKIIIDKAS